MNYHEMMEKASRAIASARLLLDAGDVDGACNRAYYAMHDAAKAALDVSYVSLNPEVIKTHSGLISAFGLKLVKTGKVPAALGKAFNRAAEIRLVADYTGEGVSAEDAQWAVEQAAVFFEAIQSMFGKPK